MKYPSKTITKRIIPAITGINLCFSKRGSKYPLFNNLKAGIYAIGNSLLSQVGSYSADVRYWDLIETLEVTTDENGKAVTEWIVSTDNSVQIVAEYAGNVEGEGGVNIGSSTASYVKGETQAQSAIGFVSSEYLFGAIGAGIAVAVCSVIVILKRRLRES